MKKAIALLCSLIMLTALVSGCAEKPVKIGIAAPKVTHNWVSAVTEYAEKYCKDNKKDYKLTVSADALEMSAALADLKQWGATAVVAYPQWTGSEEDFDRIIKAGIPVVAFDIDINCDGVYKVTGDNYGVGYLAAKYIVQKVSPAAKIAIFDRVESGSVSELRKQGFYDYLKEINYDASNVFIVNEKTFSYDDGYNDMKTALAANEKIDAVFASDDETALGITDAIIESGRKDIKAVVGCGGTQEIFRRIADVKYNELSLATTLYRPDMVVEAIKTGIELSLGHPCELSVVIPTELVSASNVEDYLDPDDLIY